MSETETGKELQGNNQQIVQFINLLRNQKSEMDYLIEKQETEKTNLEMEIERIYYKLTLITKSLAMRKKARLYYQQTINELEANYRKIVESSNVLLKSVRVGAEHLEELMDKRTGTAIMQTGKDEGENNLPQGDSIKEGGSTAESVKVEQDKSDVENLTNAELIKHSKKDPEVEIFKAGYESQHKKGTK